MNLKRRPGDRQTAVAVVKSKQELLKQVPMDIGGSARHVLTVFSMSWWEEECPPRRWGMIAEYIKLYRGTVEMRVGDYGHQYDNVEERWPGGRGF